MMKKKFQNRVKEKAKPAAPAANGQTWYRFQAKANGETRIDIMETIGMWGISAKQFRNDLKRLGAQEDIHVHINSDGGDILEGFEILNALRDHEGNVRVSIGAIAASMASVIAMAGDSVSIADNGMFMIHNPWTVTVGDSEDLRRDADTMDKMKNNIIAAYRRHSDLPADEISTLMDQETWMDAEEAKENGFVQTIDGDEDESSVKNFDLSRFNNTARFLKRLSEKHRNALGRASGAGDGKRVRLLDLIHAAQPQEEPAATGNKRGQFLNMTTAEEQAAAEAKRKADEAELEKKAKAKAEELYKAKLKRDKEIDDLVIKVRERDKKDFGELAGKFKQEDKTPDEFARAIATSDDFKAFKAVGEGPELEVVGVRGLVKGTPGEIFVASEAYKAAADRIKNQKKVSLPAGALAVDTPGFHNAPNPTSSGLTSIEKVPGVITLGVRPLTVKDLIAPGATNNTTIRYIQEQSVTIGATTVAEAGTKPQATFSLAEVDAPVKKVAAFAKVPDELFADYLAVASYINMRLPYMVERIVDSQLINGDGTGSNLTGILQTAGIQSAALGGAYAVRPDLAYHLQTLIRWQNMGSDTTAQGGFEPDGYVIHPTDWETLRLLKDSNGQYYAGGPFTGAYGNGGVIVEFNTFWGKPVVITPALAVGTYLAGAFRLGAQYFQRQGLTLETTNSDQDDFIKNLITIRAEERLALAVYRPGAFAKGTGV